ncbi:hypothetical protein JZ751_003402, partial [Albula glossodonta]
RLTKPLSFADCVGDELPWGWEAAYDPQIGIYYIDHINKTTQLEDPRKEWRKEQERMLKDYLTVAQDALSTQKELYQVKEQRLALALDEYVRLNDAYKEKSSSRTSLFSGSSSSTKYDPDILKAEISTTKVRVNKLKRELSQMKQELLYKEQGFETLQQIDQKMSGGQSGYKLKEAKAIVSELKSIRKAISSEMACNPIWQCLAKLKERFHSDQCMGRSEPDLRHPAGSHLLLSRHTLDAGSQTDVSGEVGLRSRSTLAEKVRLSLQYEEAKRRCLCCYSSPLCPLLRVSDDGCRSSPIPQGVADPGHNEPSAPGLRGQLRKRRRRWFTTGDGELMANVKIELAKLDSETWPGALDVEQERLMLINEKEELLKELQFVTPRRRTQGELERLEAERHRLEEDLLSVKSTPSQALAQRSPSSMAVEELTLPRLVKVVPQLFPVPLGAAWHCLYEPPGCLLKAQEKRRALVQRLEESTRLAMLLHSQLKSLSASTLSVSSGSSLGSLASSRGSLNASSRGSLNSLSSGDLYYSQPEQPLDLDYQYKLDLLLQEKPAYSPSGPITTIHENEVAPPPHQTTGHALPRPSEPPKSVASLSSRSSLSSLSPPGSPLVLEGGFPPCTQDATPHDLPAEFEDRGEISGVAGDFASLGFYDNQILLDPEPGEKDLGDGVQRVPLTTLREGISDTDLQRRAAGCLLEEKPACVSAAVSDESVAGDSGVYEASVKRSSEAEDQVYVEDEPAVPEAAQVQMGFKYVRVALLPSSSDVSSLFRTKVQALAGSMVLNEVFRAAVSQSTLRQKTLRADVCTVTSSRREECLAGAHISLADMPLSSDLSVHWLGMLDENSTVLIVGEEEEEEEEEEMETKEAGEAKECSGCPRPYTEEEGENEEADLEEQVEGEGVSSQTPEGPRLVDKETNTDEAGPEGLAVRPKDRSGLSSRQRPFVRNSMIMRSQTFSPGERNQYICRIPAAQSRLNRSDSDSSTLSKKSPFVRNASERRSLRVKRTICQPVVRRAAADHPARTSLDLELDLQASRTRQSRLDDELQALRGLKERLEALKARGETELPPAVLEDERFHKLLKQAEKQAEQSKEEQKQDLKAEKLMRKASKDVCRLREQSQKVPLQVQSFREKMAYFTRAKINIPSLSADDV